MSEKMSEEHVIFEALRDYPDYYVDNPNVKIGDTITYIANNQLANKKYIVVKRIDDSGNIEKGLEEIEFYPPKNSIEEPSISNFHWYPDDGSRGGKKKHKKTQHKRTRKQRFKSKSKSRMMKSKKYRRTKK